MLSLSRFGGVQLTSIQYHRLRYRWIGLYVKCETVQVGLRMAYIAIYYERKILHYEILKTY